MKFHPFNIKYVEETNENQIILHEDISRLNFKNEKIYNKTVMNQSFKNTRQILSLLHINLTNKDKDIFHGDIYLNKELGKVYIYTLKKRKEGNDIIGHGFFSLKEQKDKNKTQLIFDKNDFITVEDFVESDIIYIGNLFVHLEINKQVKDILNYELKTNKNYSLNDLKGSYKRCNGDFYSSISFKIYFFNEHRSSLSFLFYSPTVLSRELVEVNDKNDWEIGIEKEYAMYNRNFDNVYLDKFSMVTGINCQTTLNPKDLKKLFDEIKNYSSLKDKFQFLMDYKNFFAYYDGQEVIIKSIDNNGNTNEFLFDKKPIPYNINSSFFMNSNKESKSYMTELLKII